MRVVNETSAWRDIVNHTPQWRESYNVNSLSDYIDTIVTYYYELSSQYDVDDSENWQHILVVLTSLMDAQVAQFGEMGMVRVQGNGIYLPEASDKLEFFDGSPGIAGEYGGLSISKLPTYQDLLYCHEGQRQAVPVLCLELSDYRQYINDELALEPDGRSAAIPINSQDVCFSRASQVSL